MYSDPLDANNWTLITPTYSGDFEQFKLLSESVQKFAPSDLEHKIIVDRQDQKLFEPLTHPMMSFEVTENVLPGKNYITRSKPRWTVGTKILPSRGWITQQLIKIQSAANNERPYVLFADSDVIFLREFKMDRFSDGNKIALSTVDNYYPLLDKWGKTSNKLLHLKGDFKTPKNYVSNLIPWRRDNAQKLIAHLQRKLIPWTYKLTTRLNFSEYMLYGIYCDEVIGKEDSGHYPWSDPILKMSFDQHNSTSDYMKTIKKMEQDHIGVMFHSKNSINYESLYKAIKQSIT